MRVWLLILVLLVWMSECKKKSGGKGGGWGGSKGKKKGNGWFGGDSDGVDVNVRPFGGGSTFNNRMDKIFSDRDRDPSDNDK
jgi:hypothetical protein